MTKYILDTNVCISIFKNKYGIREKIIKIGHKNCFVSEITIAELFYGASKSGQQRHFEDVTNVLRLFGVVPIYSALKLYGCLKAKLEQQGQRIDDFDLLIGATAVQNEMVMVTSNTKHFDRIPNIKIEDWCNL